MSVRQLALTWWMLINGTQTKLYPALFILNGRWETDKSSLACILILNSQALHLAFRLCVYLLQRKLLLCLSFFSRVVICWEKSTSVLLWWLWNWPLLPAVDCMKRPWVVWRDKQMSNQVSMMGCNHTSRHLNIMWKSVSHLSRITGLFPIGSWTASKYKLNVWLCLVRNYKLINF